MNKAWADLASSRRVRAGGAAPSGEDTPDALLLADLASRFTASIRLTPAERAEILHIARGFASKDSAAAGDLADETVRARRKRIYKKLRVAGAGELTSALLGFSLRLLASGERLELPGSEPAPPPDGAAGTG